MNILCCRKTYRMIPFVMSLKKHVFRHHSSECGCEHIKAHMLTVELTGQGLPPSPEVLGRGASALGRER